jgi:hypothetical protein
MRPVLMRGLLALAGVAWAGGLVLGVQQLARYEAGAGAARPALERWPAEGPARHEGGFTIAVFVHPECPCSAATVSALDKIMARAGGKVKGYVFGVMPEGAPADWKSSGLLATARGIPGLSVVDDEKGALARRFGAMTSGQVVMYDASGARVFSGGITEGRGHEGPNAGAATVEALLKGRGGKAPDTPVFGCSLLGE